MSMLPAPDEQTEDQDREGNQYDVDLAGGPLHARLAEAKGDAHD